ncbi:MAG: FAD-binding protein [Verrucomicrobiales bacterium]|nr:FAD-binding protein [Verrucomicrobiales bacterium]
MTKSLLKSLQSLKRQMRPGELILDPATCADYSGDKWFARHQPDAVARPRDTKAVAQLLRYATRQGIPVTPRGAGYGYVGGCVPVQGGIALSLEKLNRILEVNPQDFVGVVQPNVITAQFQAEVEKRGLYYPPDPASRADCSLGGNIASNAGGPRCLKYGVTRDYVLGLEVVSPTGSILRLGSRTHKNKTGFDLHRLFVGSEGMLGVITEATLKLIPLPPYRACIAVGFSHMRQAIQALHSVFAQGFLPCALEIADSFTLKAARQRTGSQDLEGCNALVILELDGQTQSVRQEILAVEKLVRALRPVFIKRALGAVQSEKLWAVRREFSYALRDTGLTKLNEDVVVPRGQLEALFALAARLQKKFGISIASFGHAGDGNIHVNLMVDLDQPGAKVKSEQALDALFQGVLKLGGVVTGEHGIGIAKRPWWNLAVSPEVNELHQTIKRALDPAGILNPGKFLKPS